MSAVALPVDPIVLARSIRGLESTKFERVQVFDLEVPDHHHHEGFLDQLRRRDVQEFAAWNHRITDLAYGGQYVDPLYPGDILNVSMFKSRLGVEIPSATILQFFEHANAVFAGAHLLGLLYESDEWANIPNGVSIVAPMKRYRRLAHHSNKIPVLRKEQDRLGRPRFELTYPHTSWDNTFRFPLARLVRRRN